MFVPVILYSIFCFFMKRIIVLILCGVGLFMGSCRSFLYCGVLYFWSAEQFVVEDVLHVKHLDLVDFLSMCWLCYFLALNVSRFLYCFCVHLRGTEAVDSPDGKVA